MLDLLEIQLKLTPDILDIMQKRHRIMQHISMMQPIGRRSLAYSLGLTERVLRAEVEFLKQQGLIEIETVGMKLTEEGFLILQEASPYVKSIFGLHDLEQQLKKKLNIPNVIVVKGDSDKDELVKKEMGKSTAILLRQLIKENDVVTMTGGSTIAEVANMMSETPHLSSNIFVPARGGIGETHEYLANTIVSQMAKKVGGNYRLLHIPDVISEATYKSLVTEKYIQESLDLIRSAGIVIHGIGDAKVMALKRKVSKEILMLIDEEKAIGEAFGYYFDKDGNIVYNMKTIGMKLDDLSGISNIIAVAGGKSKANAILAVLKNNFKQTLVTDEGAANAIINK